MKFVIMSIVLTWVWIWLFRKIVVEEIDERPKPKPANVSFTNFTIQETVEERILLRPKTSRNHLSRNPVVLMWFGTYTYLMANIWKVWLNFLFGLFPVVNEDDDVEVDD